MLLFLILLAHVWNNLDVAIQQTWVWKCFGCSSFSGGEQQERVMSPGFDALRRGHAAVGSDDPYPDCNPTPQKHVPGPFDDDDSDFVPGPFDDDDSDFVPGPFVTKFPAAKCCPSSPGRNVTPANSPSKYSAHHVPSSYHGGKVTPAKLPSTIMVNYFSPGVKRSAFSWCWCEYVPCQVPFQDDGKGSSLSAGVKAIPAKSASKTTGKRSLLLLVLKPCLVHLNWRAIFAKHNPVSEKGRCTPLGHQMQHHLRTFPGDLS
ncbi:hypothetical protein MHU86_14235 [Fragilaria crotonensis]|nr:hypothetical protein MHU86_14235 [Fragilaria crotonensis]